MARRVAIIGGGWGGIATAVELRRRGFRSFTIFERNNGPGGVWLVNTFPGLTVDVPSQLYSFSSYRSFPWSRTHARREEILRYTEELIDRFALRSHFRFDTVVSHVTWDDELEVYWVDTTCGDRLVFDVVISAVGLFNTPRYPSWPGMEDFRGIVFHTARWEHEHDLAGRRIAVVGTGATSAQVVPALAPTAGKLFVFQREPGWALPRNDRDHTSAEQSALARPLRGARERFLSYCAVERMILLGMTRSRRRKSRLQRRAEAYVASILGDRPDLARRVTPTHPVLGKRPIFDAGYYAALRRDNVELVPRAVARVTKDGVVDSDGVEREVDVLVLATGFTASNYLSTLEVSGRGGRRLRDVWGPEPCAFLGITVPGFPNFFIVYGPNTNGGGSIAVQIERQAQHIARVVHRMKRRGVTTVEAPQWAARAWDRYVTWRNERQVYASTSNYFRARTGKVVTQWPGTMTEYWLLTRLGRLALTESRARRISVPVTDESRSVSSSRSACTQTVESRTAAGSATSRCA